MIVPQSDEFWTKLADLCSLLKPFQVATDLVQSDSSSLFDIYSQFHRLLKHIKSLKPTDAFFNVSKQAKNVILTEWNNHVNEDAVICCAAFSFDSTHLQLFDSQKRLAAAEWFLDFGVNFLTFYKLTLEKDEMNLRATLRKQHAEFEGREGPFLNMDDIKKDLIRAHARQNTTPISAHKPGTSPLPVSTPPAAEQHMCFWQPSLLWFRYQKLRSGTDSMRAGVTLHHSDGGGCGTQLQRTGYGSLEEEESSTGQLGGTRDVHQVQPSAAR